jgi:hypothetical protein
VLIRRASPTAVGNRALARLTEDDSFIAKIELESRNSKEIGVSMDVEYWLLCSSPLII